MNTVNPQKVLLVDAGNSRLKWAISEGGQWLETYSFAYQRDDLAKQLAHAWARSSKPGDLPQRILLANVAGEQISTALRQWVKQLSADQKSPSISLEIVTSQASAYGVNNAYAEPARLGVDRWLGLLAARHHLNGPVCIVDCGTALTVDILDAEGQHQGGIIVPGIKLMEKSLVDNTSDIYPGETSVRGFLGRDTQSALHAGALAAASGAVMQVLHQAQAELGLTLTTVITGGDAEALLTVLPDDCHHEPHWVLKGLAVIVEARS